jgi:5-methylthioadenosine/S-adenosylhomocysteine deaminase
MPEKTIFEHATIVTMDSERRIFEEGAVVVEGKRILQVGDNDVIKKGHKADHIIDSRRKVLLPGLVSLHFHSDNFSRGVGEHMGLEEWLGTIYYPMLRAMTPEDSYWAAMLAYAEAVRGGTTCVNDMYRHLGSCAKAAEAVGLRAVLSSEAADLIEGQETLKDNENAFRDIDGKADGRIRVWFGVEWIPVCSKEFLAETRELADRYHTGIHIHLNESKAEVELSSKKYGLRPVELAYDQGVLGSDCVAAHCVWLSDKEIKLLKDTRTHVAHCPVSNAKLGNGVARTYEMVKIGINVGLGPDDAPCNNNVDMFETMKYASLFQKATLMDASVLPAAKVLEMATHNGARALGLENQIGRIESGMKADIILVDMNTPRLTPVHFGDNLNVIQHLVYAAHGDDVDTVMIDGRMVMKERKLVAVDEQEVIDKATQASRRVIEERKKYLKK